MSSMKLDFRLEIADFGKKTIDIQLIILYHIYGENTNYLVKK